MTVKFLKENYQNKLKLLKENYQEDLLEDKLKSLKEYHQKLPEMENQFKFLKENYQKKLSDYQKKLSEFSEAKRQLKKYEHELDIEGSVSVWFFGNAKEDFGYAIWHICDKSSPDTNWNKEIIELMLEKGGNINHICEEKTPLDIYIYSSYLPWRMHKDTEKNVKKNIKILRDLGALTKEELDNQNK